MGRPGDIDNVQLVRRYYDAFNAGDLDAVMALCHDSVEYVNPPDAAEPGTRYGRGSFRRALEGLAAGFEGFQIAIQTISSAGNEVTVVARSTGRGRSSGIPFEELQRHVLHVDCGRIARFEWFRDLGTARAAEGEPVARDDVA
jgi:ketosteroid isomerase-like protein